MEGICNRFVPGYTPERGRGEGGAYTRGLKDMILWYLFQVCLQLIIIIVILHLFFVFCASTFSKDAMRNQLHCFVFACFGLIHPSCDYPF